MYICIHLHACFFFFFLCEYTCICYYMLFLILLIFNIHVHVNATMLNIWRFSHQYIFFRFLVTTVESTSAALSIFMSQKHNLDIIIVEAEMPHMDGFEFLQHIHTQKKTTPLICKSLIINTSLYLIRWQN